MYKCPPMSLIQQAKRWLKCSVTVGGYTVGCYLTSGDRVCRQCAIDDWSNIVGSTLHDENDGFGILALDVYWEGPDEYCDCGEVFSSEYGDPEGQDK